MNYMITGAMLSFYLLIVFDMFLTHGVNNSSRYLKAHAPRPELVSFVSYGRTEWKAPHCH